MELLEPKRWVSKYADYLLRYAMFRLNDEEHCQDLVQDTFLAALKAKENFKGNSSEKTWLTSILKKSIKKLTSDESISFSKDKKNS